MAVLTDERFIYRQIKDCEANLAKYGLLIEQQPAVTSVGAWIAEASPDVPALHPTLVPVADQRP